MKARIPLLLLLLLLSRCTTPHIETSPANFPLEVAESIPHTSAHVWTLSNGLRVRFTEDRELPLFSATVFTPKGSLAADARWPGAAEIMGQESSLGGTQALAPNTLRELLQSHGATLSSSLGPEFGRFHIEGLSSDAPLLLDLLSQTLQTPRFDLHSLSLAKNRKTEELRRRRDDPAAIATLSAQKLLFPQSVYGRVLTAQALSAISRQQLRAEHKRLITPRGAILCLQGPFSSEDAQRLVEQIFGRWLNSPASKQEPILARDPAPSPTLLWVEKSSAQAIVLLSRQGAVRHSPDEMAIEVFNAIFGLSGANSLLSRHVRSRLGLAYSVFGGIYPGLELGRNSILIRTSPPKTYAALREALRAVQFMQSTGPNAEELASTKRGLRNAHVFQHDTISKSLERQAVLELLGYPKEYDQTFFQRLEGVAREDILRVSREQWELSHAILVVVGPRSAFQSVVEGLSSSPELWPKFELRRGQFSDHLELIQGMSRPSSSSELS